MLFPTPTPLYCHLLENDLNRQSGNVYKVNGTPKVWFHCVLPSLQICTWGPPHEKQEDLQTKSKNARN